MKKIYNQARFVFFGTVLLSIITYLIDNYMIVDSSASVAFFEIASELFFSLYFTKALWTSSRSQNSMLSLIFLAFALSFLVSDFFFAREFYFGFEASESFSVFSITLPCFLGFTFSSAGLLYLVTPYIVRSLKVNNTQGLILIATSFILFSWLSIELFLLNFEGKYGKIAFDTLNALRFLAVYVGSFAGALGFIVLSVSRDIWISLFGLGAILQLLGDWSMRLKEYLNEDLFIGYGEYIFFIGLFLILFSGTKLLDFKRKSGQFPLNSIAKQERLALLIPILVFLTYASFKHTYRVEILDLFFTAGCLVAGAIYYSSIGSIYNLQKIIDYTKKYSYSTNERESVRFFPYEMSQIKQNLDARSLEHARHKAIAESMQFIAHDIKKPFIMLKHYLKVVERGDEKNFLASRMLESLKSNISVVNSLLDDVMEIINESNIVLSTCNLVDITAESVSRVKSQILNPLDLNVRCEIDDRIVVLANAPKLIRVLVNIISNAFQAIDGLGMTPAMIYIDAKYVNQDGLQFTRITIGNFGTYIKKERQGKIFDYFTTYEKKDGTGLGLAIVKKIVMMHNGTVKCISVNNKDSAKRKTEFVLDIPSGINSTNEKI